MGYFHFDPSVETIIILERFYSKAPVPVALKLYPHPHTETNEKPKASDFLQKELDLFCDSGSSFGVFHNGKIIGAGFNLFVDRLVNILNDFKVFQSVKIIVRAMAI